MRAWAAPVDLIDELAAALLRISQLAERRIFLSRECGQVPGRCSILLRLRNRNNALSPNQKHERIGVHRQKQQRDGVAGQGCSSATAGPCSCRSTIHPDCTALVQQP